MVDAFSSDGYLFDTFCRHMSILCLPFRPSLDFNSTSRRSIFPHLPSRPRILQCDSSAKKFALNILFRYNRVSPSISVSVTIVFFWPMFLSTWLQSLAARHIFFLFGQLNILRLSIETDPTRSSLDFVGLNVFMGWVIEDRDRCCTSTLAIVSIFDWRVDS